MRKFGRRLKYWLQRSQIDAELSEEIEFHREMLGEHAGANLGNTTLAREEARGVWIWPWLESLVRDLQYGLRGMRRNPGFTTVALAALGIAIGLNTSLYTAFNALAIRPWPVDDPASVVLVQGGYSIAEVRYLNHQAKSFSGVIGTRGADVKLNDRPLRSYYVTGNYFRVLGVGMRLGRGFRDDEDQIADPQAVGVISSTIWENRFGSDPQIVGKTIRVDDVPVTIVGVAAPEFSGTEVEQTHLWLPMASVLLLRPGNADMRSFLTSPEQCCSQMAARLASGVSSEQARAESEPLLNQFRAEYHLKPVKVALGGTSFLARAGEKLERALSLVGLVMLGTLMVLMLACANVGNLLLARAVARRREIAVRLSVGGSRGRLVRQLLVESMTLAIVASGIGLAIAFALPRMALSWISHSEFGLVRPDLSVLAFTIVLAVLACVTFGLAPALHATRGDIANALKERSTLAGVRLSLRSTLLAVQVALSVILLAGAGMLFRAVQRASKLDLGFDANTVSVISLDLPANAYSGTRAATFSRELVANLPTGLALCDREPLSTRTSMGPFRLPGEEESHNRWTIYYRVNPTYFEMLRIPIVAGRSFLAGDDKKPVALVNERMARQYWPNESAVGKTLISVTPKQIVGVVKDSRTQGLEPGFLMYFPIGPDQLPQILVKGDARPMAQQITALATQLEPRAHVEWKPLSENLRRTLAPGLAGASIAATLGIVAVLLACIGMAGVFGYAVQQRTREIGIRMAMGARPNNVVLVVLGSNSKAVAMGLLAGLAGAAASAKLLAHVMVGVSASDPSAYIASLGVLLLAAMAAAVVPARRATRIDPVKALRWE